MPKTAPKKPLSKKKQQEIEERREENAEREFHLRANGKGWENCLHPDTETALDHVDAAMFTGDPSETVAGYDRLRFYVERWMRCLDGNKGWRKKYIDEVKQK